MAHNKKSGQPWKSPERQEGEDREIIPGLYHWYERINLSKNCALKTWGGVLKRKHLCKGKIPPPQPYILWGKNAFVTPLLHLRRDFTIYTSSKEGTFNPSDDFSQTLILKIL